jgi:hypothetical protein
MIPDRCGYCLVFLEGERGVLVLVPISETGMVHLEIAGFYLGDWQLLGENHRLAMKVRAISRDTMRTLEPKVREALPADLRNRPFS